MSEPGAMFDPRSMRKFREFLEKQPGPMADGYADFAAMMDFAERMQAVNGATPSEIAAAHLLRGLTYAFTETMQAGVSRGLDPLDLALALPRVAGCCTFNVLASVIDSGAPWRRLNKMIDEGFRQGTRYTCDLLVKAEKESA